MSNNKPAEFNDASYMSRILDPRLIQAMQPTRKRMLWTDDLHKIFVKAVAYHGGPHAAKPYAVKQTMQAMGVTSLTIQNIKSHLQKYREKCILGTGNPDDVLDATSPSKAAFNLMSKMMMATHAVMAETEVVTRVNNFLMGDVELIELNSMFPQTVVEEYMDDLANYAFGHLDSANISLRLSRAPLASPLFSCNQKN